MPPDGYGESTAQDAVYNVRGVLYTSIHTGQKQRWMATVQLERYCPSVDIMMTPKILYTFRPVERKMMFLFRFIEAACFLLHTP
jgi:hypothetical protein